MRVYKCLSVTGWEQVTSGLHSVSAAITDSMQKFYYRFGVLIGCFPVITIVTCLLLCAALGSGLFYFFEETDDIKLWTTIDSEIRDNAEWIQRHFHGGIKFETILVTAENILTPEIFKLLLDIDRDVKNINSSGNDWSSVCARYGNFLTNSGSREKRSAPRRFDGRHRIRKRNSEGATTTETYFSSYHSMKDEPEIDYYDFFGIEEGSLDRDPGQDEGCLYKSVLELWAENLDQVETLTKKEIIGNVTEDLDNGSNIGQLLSGVERDSNGDVVSANATLLVWMIRDQSVEDFNGIKRDPISDEWELRFMKDVVESERNITDRVQVHGFTTRSFDDALHEAVFSSYMVLVCGFFLVLIYIGCMLGRWNYVEQRVYLSVMGVLSVGMAVLATYGLCAFAGVIYGPIHDVTPFLLLGIGVDDMFVIIQALENLSPEDKLLPVPERIGKSLQHAGVSITITSITDMVAFGIGASTAIPSLNSFCTYCTVGITFVFLVELTFFVGCATLDERRISQRRGGVFCRQVPHTWKPNTCSRREFYKMFFGDYIGPFSTRMPVKVAVITITLVLAAVNVWSIFQVEQNFDPIEYLRPGSPAITYAEALEEYFPENGERSEAFVGDIDYFNENEELNKLYTGLRENPFIKRDSVQFWYRDFQEWLDNEGRSGHRLTNIRDFNSELSEFLLFYDGGQKYIRDIAFVGDLLDDFNITASRITFRHIYMNNTYIKNHAMELLKELANNVNFTSGSIHHPIFYTYKYMQWEANKVISEELAGNLAFTISMVLVVTVVMINNLRASFWVFTCVALTLIDVAGSIYFFGLTIEVATSILLILSVGLAVDYSAHIGQTFTTLRGSRNERACETLRLMGPPVLNGGLSTFMAIILLPLSGNYLIIAFFKVFSAVVVYGLFHGLVYLPVMLSLLGPEPPPTVVKEEEKEKKICVYTIPVDLQAEFRNNKNEL